MFARQRDDVAADPVGPSDVAQPGGGVSLESIRAGDSVLAVTPGAGNGEYT